MKSAGSGPSLPERQRLITSCQGLVRALAWRMHQRLPAHVDLDDLVAYGQVGLAEAARDFDAARGSQFSTYAWYRVRGSILDGLSRMRWFSRGDFEGGRYDRLIDDDESAVTAEACPASGQGPLPEGSAGGLDIAVLMLQSGDGYEDEIADTVRGQPEQIATRREIAGRLRELVDALPSDMATLVREIYFRGQTLTAAAETAGISKAWASRLHARAMDRLKAAFRAAGLLDA